MWESVAGHHHATAPQPAGTGGGVGSNGACASGRAKVEDAGPFSLLPRFSKTCENLRPPSQGHGKEIESAQIHFGTQFDSPGCGILQSLQGWQPSNHAMMSALTLVWQKAWSGRRTVDIFILILDDQIRLNERIYHHWKTLCAVTFWKGSMH